MHEQQCRTKHMVSVTPLAHEWRLPVPTAKVLDKKRRTGLQLHGTASLSSRRPQTQLTVRRTPVSLQQCAAERGQKSNFIYYLFIYLFISAFGISYPGF